LILYSSKIIYHLPLAASPLKGGIFFQAKIAINKTDYIIRTFVFAVCERKGESDKLIGIGQAKYHEQCKVALKVSCK